MHGTIKRSDGRTYVISLNDDINYASLRGTIITEIFILKDGSLNNNLEIKENWFSIYDNDNINVFDLNCLEVISFKRNSGIIIIEFRFNNSELILKYSLNSPEMKAIFQKHINLLKPILHLPKEFKI